MDFKTKIVESMTGFEKEKKKLLEVATELFAKFGYKKTTLDEIAHGAGKGKSSLYYYFKSKEEVFAAVVEQEVNLLEQKIEDAVMSVNTAGDKLKTYIRTRIDTIKKMTILTEAIKNDLLSHYLFIKKIRETYFIKEVNMVKGILDLGVKNERFNITDTDAIARSIVTIIKAVEIPVIYDLKDKTLDHEIDVIQEIILYGIIKR